MGKLEGGRYCKGGKTMANTGKGEEQFQSQKWNRTGRWERVEVMGESWKARKREGTKLKRAGPRREDAENTE